MYPLSREIRPRGLYPLSREIRPRGLYPLSREIRPRGSLCTYCPERSVPEVRFVPIVQRDPSPRFVPIIQRSVPEIRFVPIIQRSVPEVLFACCGDVNEASDKRNGRFEHLPKAGPRCPEHSTGEVGEGGLEEAASFLEREGRWRGGGRLVGWIDGWTEVWLAGLLFGRSFSCVNVYRCISLVLFSFT